MRPLLLMHHHRLLLEPGVYLDARRAVWFEEAQTLAVADLHLGYAWAQRSRGSMMPLSVEDDAVARLVELAREYGAKELLVLGDVVQKAVPLEPVRAELRALCRELGSVLRLRLLGGNHDRGLARLLTECDFSMEVQEVARVGRHRLLHGDVVRPELLQTEPGGRVFMGHEHPAINVGDGVASLKCPCFLVGPQVVVLPAFSKWAAGGNVRARSFLSPLAQGASFHAAVAVMGDKVLPMKL